MDPLSQAVTGAGFAASFCRRKEVIPKVLLIGALSGMAPDLDILIRSETDPLLALEYHRHFTHSLFFAPIFALLCAGFYYLFPLIKQSMHFAECYAFSLLGMLTHGTLDACTGYGTHLLWPLSERRESWNIIGIIDPAYTIPVLILVIAAAIRKSQRLSILAFVWMLAYLSLGIFQEYRAYDLMEEKLAAEGIAHERLTVRPTIANLWLWRVLYLDEASNQWQTHALHLPFWGSAPTLKTGEAAPNLPAHYYADYPADTVAGDDLRRFAFFSNQYLSLNEKQDGTVFIGDARYGMTPDSARPLWGIVMPEARDQHVERLAGLRKRINWQEVADLFAGEGFTPLAEVRLRAEGSNDH